MRPCTTPMSHFCQPRCLNRSNDKYIEVAAHLDRRESSSNRNEIPSIPRRDGLDNAPSRRLPQDVAWPDQRSRSCVLLVNMKLRLSWKGEPLKDRRESDRCEVKKVCKILAAYISSLEVLVLWLYRRPKPLQRVFK
jgi:hypothetical protein